MAKYRSILNFANQYSAYKQGYAIGIENFPFLREETQAGVFTPPRLGLQAYSRSGDNAPTDISTEPDGTIIISVDGGVPVTANIATATLNTANSIVNALENAINTALGTAGQDARVWVDFDSTNGRYIIYSQKTLAKNVTVTGGTLASVLKLGVVNGGVEQLGSPSPDYFWVQKIGVKHSQDFEMSKHRSGRQASNIIKKKKMLEGDVEMYVNIGTNPSTNSVIIDESVKLLLKCIFGNMRESANEISFDQAQPPQTYFSLVQGNNVFGRYANGCYVKNFTLTLPGDGEASMKFTMKGRESKECSIAKISTAVNNNAIVTCVNNEEENFEPGARVMIVDVDGRTILDGYDGTLLINSVNLQSNTITLNRNVTIPANGYLVPWLPHVFGFGGVDNPITGLQGYVSFDGGTTRIEEIKSVEISVDPKTEDLDNFYGTDTNRGYIVGDRSEISVKVEMLLSASQFRKIMQTRRFQEFEMKIVLGDENGRHLEVYCPRVLYKIPGVEIPDAGSIPVTFEGFALQRELGSLDAIKLTYR
ncbi:MAG: phage tail tube protein [Candidatus Bilamarchaeaceae archaeon]